MKKTTLLFVTLILFVASYVKAQENCFEYFPQKKGVSYETKSYDKKDKLTGTEVQTLTDRMQEGNREQVNFEIKSTNPESDTTIVSEISIICEDGKVYFDLSGHLNKEQVAAYEGMDIEIDADNVEFPKNPVAGQSLGDGSVVAKVTNNGSLIMTLTVNITNRKVDIIENITTPAGTFNCVKISYDSEIEMGFMSMKTSGADWYSKGTGVVRSESYNKKGKLTSYSILTKISGE